MPGPRRTPDPDREGGRRVPQGLLPERWEQRLGLRDSRGAAWHPLPTIARAPIRRSSKEVCKHERASALPRRLVNTLLSSTLRVSDSGGLGGA